MSDSQFDPVRANGSGSDNFDQPTVFFLTHQTVIERWAALSSAAAETTQRWILTTVRDGLSGLAAEVGMEVSAVAGPNHWQHLLLHPPETPTVDGQPVIGVGLCWHDQKLNPKSYLPFVGIRIQPGLLGAAACAAFLDAGDVHLHPEEHLYGKGDPTWPAYFYVTAAAEHWWADLDAYKDLLLAQVRIGLVRFGDPMRAAIRKLESA